MRPETTDERQARHDACIAAYRELLDPASPPRAPYLFEHFFFAPESADVTAFTNALEDKGYQIDTFSFNPDSQDRTWAIVALKVDFLEERKVISFSDELDGLARQHGVTYDGWLTRVE